MIDLEIKVEPKLEPIFKRWAKQVREGTRAGLKASTEFGGSLVRLEVPRRSGGLSDSVTTLFDDERGVVQTSAKGARLLDQGGTVRGRPLLRVPISADAKAGRQLSGLFSVRSRAGNLILAERTRAGIRPHFALVRSVTVRARHFMERAADRLRAVIAAIVGGRIHRELLKGE